MDTRRIEYRAGMPFYPVTNPVKEADGLLIEDLRLQQLIDYLNEKDIRSAYVYGMENFEFLNESTRLEHLRIELRLPLREFLKLKKRKSGNLEKIYDIRPLYNLENIRGLSIVNNEQPFIIPKMKLDLSKLPTLEYICIDDCFIENLSEAKNLRSAWINSYHGKDLQELSSLEKLDTLDLTSSKIKSLDGCQQIKKLQCLYLYYNRSLSDISALEGVKDSLKALRIENCAKIKDFSVLEKLENLELLDLSGSNEIPSLSFIGKLKNLKVFVFSVNVLDGDLTSCEDLSYAACVRGRKHYNMKDRDLPKGKVTRGNEDIELWRRFE